MADIITGGIYVQLRDINGNLIYDINGDPIYAFQNYLDAYSLGVSPLSITSINITDNVNVSESVTVKNSELNVSIIDNVSVSESKTISLDTTQNLNINVYEICYSRDYITPTLSNLIINKYDNVNVSESRTVNVTSYVPPGTSTILAIPGPGPIPLRPRIYRPRRDRILGDSLSAELFTEGADIIKNVKIKFYIEDDGGDWEDGTLIKPQFIWDMKKIVSGYVIDDGNFDNHVNLKSLNCKETSEGIYFIGEPSSYLYSQFMNLNISTQYAVFNIWFTPEYGGGLLAGVNSGTTRLLEISVPPGNINSTEYPIMWIGLSRCYEDPTNYCNLRYYFLIDSSPWKILATDNYKIPLSKTNIIFYFTPTNFSHYINGRKAQIPIGPLSLGLPRDIKFKIGQNFKGEIYYASINMSQWSISEDIVKNMYKFQYPLPRGKEYVDLSEEFETNGRNLLVEARNIEKAIENLKGNLYIKSNTVTVRN